MSPKVPRRVLITAVPRLFGVAYVVLATVTLFFKFLYLRGVFGSGRLGQALAISPSSGLWDWVRALIATSASDLLQVAWITAVLCIISRLFRWRLSIVFLIALTVAVIAGWLNWFTTRQVGTLLTLDVFGLAIDWIAAYPTAVSGFVPLHSTMQALGLLVALGALIVIVRRTGARRIGERVTIVPLFVSLVLLSVAGLHAAFADTVQAQSALSTPYWTAAAQSVLGTSTLNPLSIDLLSDAEAHNVRAELEHGAGSREPNSNTPVIADSSARVKYVVVLALETAPLAYYPIIDNPEFPGFWRMSHPGLASTHHYATMPFTTESLYSVASGQYPVANISRLVRKRTSRESVMSRLESRGFETAFVDSYSSRWGWSDHVRDLWPAIGFRKVLSGRNEQLLYRPLIAAERASAMRALSVIDSAKSRTHGAVIVVSTAMGHYPWPSERTGISALESVKGVAHAMDSVVSILLDGLASRSIAESSAVIVIGDHGFRFGEEFSSLGRQLDEHQLTFNVPLIVYAPGAIRNEVRLATNSSHVDVAPTILSLAGIDTNGLMLHGRDLRSVIPRRAIYSFSTGLSPYQVLIEGESRATLNELSGDVVKVRGAGATLMSTADAVSVSNRIAAARMSIARAFAWQFPKTTPLRQRSAVTQ